GHPRASAPRCQHISFQRHPSCAECGTERQAVARSAELDPCGGVMRPASRADRSRLPPIGPSPGFRFAAIHKDRLRNQLGLWSAEHRSLPVVNFVLVLPAGSSADFDGYERLAAITADMLDQRTGHLSALDVNGAFARAGAHL